MSEIIKKSFEAYKKGGIKGFKEKYREHKLDYPPLRKNIQYAIRGKLSQKRRFIKELDGYKMYLDYSDKGLSQQLYISGYREPECTNIIKKTVKKGMTVYDIGANMGFFAVLEAKLVGDKGKVYAVEPNSDCLQLLLDNKKLNDLDNMICNYGAIGDKNAKIKLYVPNMFNRSSIMEKSDAFEMVEMTTFDSYIKDKRKPDFIRMDVEGYEFYIIEGMKKFLKTKQPCSIFMEVHLFIMQEKGINYSTMFDDLFKAGFKVTYIVKKHGWLREEIVDIKEINCTFDLIYAFKENKMLPKGYHQGFGVFFERK